MDVNECTCCHNDDAMDGHFECSACLYAIAAYRQAPWEWPLDSLVVRYVSGTPVRREVSAAETERREKAQSPRIGYPGAEQMMRYQRDYK